MCGIITSSSIIYVYTHICIYIYIYTYIYICVVCCRAYRAPVLRVRDELVRGEDGVEEDARSVDPGGFVAHVGDPVRRLHRQAPHINSNSSVNMSMHIITSNRLLVSVLTLVLTLALTLLLTYVYICVYIYIYIHIMYIIHV